MARVVVVAAVDHEGPWGVGEDGLRRHELLFENHASQCIILVGRRRTEYKPCKCPRYSGIMGPMTTRQVWGLRLKGLRKRAGLTQAMLGSEMGVRQQAIALWEGGQSLPRPEIRVALAVRLGDTAEILESALNGDDDPAWMEKLPPLTVKAGDHRRAESEKEVRARFLGLLRARLVEEGHDELADVPLDEIEAFYRFRWMGATVEPTKDPKHPADFRVDLGDGVMIDVETKLNRERPLDRVDRPTRQRVRSRERRLQSALRTFGSMVNHPAGTEVEKALLTVVTILVNRQNEVERLVEAQAQVIEDALRDLGKTATVVRSSREIVDRIEELLRERPWEHVAVLG